MNDNKKPTNWKAILLGALVDFIVGLVLLLIDKMT